VFPRKATIRLASNIPGIKLTLDGQPLATPAGVLAVAGMTRTLGAAATQTFNGKTYRFVSWSDGGAASHSITAPVADTTYTAQYRLEKHLTTATTSYVRNGPYAGQNFGSSPQLLVSRSDVAGNTREAYLRFDLSSVSSINTARLRLFGRLSAAAASGVRTSVFAAANTSWTEAGLTWNNRPASGAAALASATIRGTAGAWYEWDVTTYLRAQKAAGRNLVTLILRNPFTSLPWCIFNSDDATSNRPELVVT
jgi:hypothetical protein